MILQAHYVYILQSLSVDRDYIGETKDVEKRLAVHNDDSRGTYTSKHGPWELKRVITVTSRSEGRKLERYIKRRKSKKYVIRLITDRDAGEKLLNRVRNSSGG